MKKETRGMLEQSFWMNKKGEPVHKDLIKIDEQIKTELVYGLTDTAQRGVDILERFKYTVVNRVEAYINEMREKYNLDVAKSMKGNITLVSYDGLRKIQIAVQTRIDFDEKLSLAKEKLDEYFTLKTKDSDPEIRTLITRVFEVDKKGNVNAKQILSLKSYKISHPVWVEAMAIIDDAVEIVGSKSYVRFYTRQSIKESWVNIALDFAAV